MTIELYNLPGPIITNYYNRLISSSSGYQSSVDKSKPNQLPANNIRILSQSKIVLNPKRKPITCDYFWHSIENHSITNN